MVIILANKGGRPKFYAHTSERYVVYNKKKPVIRVTPEEKALIKALQSDEDLRKNIFNMVTKKIGLEKFNSLK